MGAAGRTALVTGAARRVGRAIALELAQAGCNVAVHYLSSKADAADLAEQIATTGRQSCLIRGDLADADTPARLVAEAVARLGRLDILINNAAVFDRISLDQFDYDAWQRVMQVNLTAVAALCHHARPHLASTGAGRIVNICDISGERPWPGHLAYCVSKAGLACLTKALARKLAPEVRVNGVAPGIAAFPDDLDQDARDRLTARVPMRRAGSPQDVAAAVRFLVENGDYITGQIINVDGGRSIA